MTYKTEIRKIEQAFGQHAVEPFQHVADWVVKGFGVVYFNGRIDIAFEPEETVDEYGRVDFGIYAMNHLETIHWRGHSLKVPPVELHILSNRRRKRTNRVQLIEEYIAHRAEC